MTDEHRTESTSKPGRLRTATWKAFQALRSLFVYPSGGVLGLDYDRYWETKTFAASTGLSSWGADRARIIGGIVRRGERVIDVGCGSGALLTALTQSHDIEAIGVDTSFLAVAEAQRRGVEAVQASVTDGLPEALGRTDWVIMCEVLEHLPEPEVLLLEAVRRAEQGVIVTVPNTGYLRHRMRLLLGRFPLQWVSHPGEHLRFWTLTDFRWWARFLGLQVVGEHHYRGIPLLRNARPHLFAAGLCFQLRIAEDAHMPRPE